MTKVVMRKLGAGRDARLIPDEDEAAEVLARFFSKVLPEPNSGCWLWIGSLCGSLGYGEFWAVRRKVRAHRFAFEYFKRPLSQNEQVLHKCDVPSCVNPDHLWAGSVQENLADMRAKGRGGYTGERHVLSRLTCEAVRVGRSERMGPTQFAKTYGVSIATAHSALRGKTWSHVR